MRRPFLNIVKTRPAAASVVNCRAAASVVNRRPAASVVRSRSRPIESETESSEETESRSSGSSESETESSEETESRSSGSSSESESESVHDSTVDANGACVESNGRSRRGPLSAALTELDMLDCPICLEPLCSPVYQCKNGHIACASCCTRMRNKCSNCRCRIGTIRCRVLEKVLESVRVPCPNMSSGCMKTLNYSKRLNHEKTCKYAPCSCPYIGCKYLDMPIGLYKHFARLHSQSSKHFFLKSPVSISLDNHQKHVFLQERKHKAVFILNRTITSLGSLIKVVYVGPVCAKGPSFFYDLRANIDGETSIRIKTSVECMAKWTPEACSKRCLVIPGDLIGLNGQLKLELNIWKNPAFAG